MKTVIVLIDETKEYTNCLVYCHKKTLPVM